jgi:hypothetical protein
VGETYTISNNNLVSDGKYKKFLECCIRAIKFDYGVSKGFWPLFLYFKLARFKAIEPISCDFVPPNDPNIIY